VDVSYVGHPLAYAPGPPVSREEFAAEYGLDLARQWIGLLPGSRQKEVRMNLPAMLAAAGQLGSQYEYLAPLASTLQRDWLEQQLSAASVPIKLTENARATVKHARAAVVASGTATVETALAGTPFVVVYRLAPLTWLLGRRLVRLDTFAMPNLIAGRRIVAELIQHDFTPENIVHELRAILPDAPRRARMIADLRQVQEGLCDHSSADQPATRAAREILQNLTKQPGVEP